MFLQPSFGVHSTFFWCLPTSFGLSASCHSYSSTISQSSCCPTITVIYYAWSSANSSSNLYSLCQFPESFISSHGIIHSSILQSTSTSFPCVGLLKLGGSFWWYFLVAFMQRWEYWIWLALLLGTCRTAEIWWEVGGIL